MADAKALHSKYSSVSVEELAVEIGVRRGKNLVKTKGNITDSMADGASGCYDGKTNQGPRPCADESLLLILVREDCHQCPPYVIFSLFSPLDRSVDALNRNRAVVPTRSTRIRCITHRHQNSEYLGGHDGMPHTRAGRRTYSCHYSIQYGSGRACSRGRLHLCGSLCQRAQSAGQRRVSTSPTLPFIRAHLTH